jgi:pimeloyl-ACP methyl ester carboxylesterase
MSKILTASIFVASVAAVGPVHSDEPIGTAVLVHGAVLDGSGWRAVHDLLVEEGMKVHVVQLPLTSLADDVAATRQAIAHQEGAVVLVGSSYGGAVITVAGIDPKVSSLVYVAALQPDIGETIAELNGQWPMEAHGLDLGNGTMVVDPRYFRQEVAADLPESTTRFMAAAQRPTAVEVYTTGMPDAAWHHKPSFAIVATEDKTLNPDMLRFMYDRSGSEVIELDAAHLPHISQPEPVAELILRAADYRQSRDK